MSVTKVERDQHAAEKRLNRKQGTAMNIRTRLAIAAIVMTSTIGIAGVAEAKSTTTTTAATRILPPRLCPPLRCHPPQPPTI